jgi:hypothetical protein
MLSTWFPKLRGGVLRADTDQGIGPLLWLPRFLTLFIGLWTPWYHFALAARMPALPTVVSFYVFFFFLVAGILIWKKPFRAMGKTDRIALWSVGLLAAACGLLTAVLSLPNDDDFSYYHRILYQLLSPNQPFILTHTGDNVPGLPSLSIVETATSYEPLVGFTAYLLHIQPLWAYQTGAAIISGAALPIVYFALYRKFRLPLWTAYGATVFAMLFFLIDGGMSRTFGNMAFVHIWEGKAIFWTVVLPLMTLYALDFLFRPGWLTWSWLFLACVASTGLSNSGTYMPEVLLIAIALSYSLTVPRGRFRAPVFFGLIFAAIYSIGYALALIVGLIPQPSDIQVYTNPHLWSHVWTKNLGLVIPNGWAMVRDLIILIPLPLMALRKSLRVYSLAYFCLIILLALNPLAADFWMKHILPANYWRLAYLLPLPWCFGLLARLFSPVYWAVPVRRKTVALVASLLLFGVISFRYVTLPNGRYVFAKPIDGPKLRTNDVRFLSQCAPSLHGQSLLAPEPVAVTAALLDPTVQLECGRQYETYQVFSLAHRPAEGLRREIAQRAVWSKKNDPRYEAAFIAACHDGVDRVIVPDSLLPRVQPYMQASGENWQPALHADGLNLFVASPVAATAAAPTTHVVYPGQTRSQ